MDWNFIAGFFDGEGSLTQHKDRFRISIPQTNEEVLKLILEFTGLGSVIKVTKRKKHWKDSWIYYIAKQDDVYRFIEKIKNKVLVKNQIIKTAIPKLKIKIIKLHNKRRLSEWRAKEAKKLRKQGMSFRAIGKKLKIDWGHARRLAIKKAWCP